MFFYKLAYTVLTVYMITYMDRTPQNDTTVGSCTNFTKILLLTTITKVFHIF